MAGTARPMPTWARTHLRGTRDGDGYDPMDRPYRSRGLRNGGAFYLFPDSAERMNWKYSVVGLALWFLGLPQAPVRVAVSSHNAASTGMQCLPATSSWETGSSP
jgi:hypothetical protein